MCLRKHWLYSIFWSCPAVAFNKLGFGQEVLWLLLVLNSVAKQFCLHSLLQSLYKKQQIAHPSGSLRLAFEGPPPYCGTGCLQFFFSVQEPSGPLRERRMRLCAECCFTGRVKVIFPVDSGRLDHIWKYVSLQYLLLRIASTRLCVLLVCLFEQEAFCSKKREKRITSRQSCPVVQLYQNALWFFFWVIMVVQQTNEKKKFLQGFLFNTTVLSQGMDVDRVSFNSQKDFTFPGSHSLNILTSQSLCSINCLTPCHFYSRIQSSQRPRP